MCGTTPKPLKSCGLRTQKDVVLSPEMIGKRLLHEPNDVHCTVCICTHYSGLASSALHIVQCTI